MKYILPLSIITLFLTGCATPEYTMEYERCSAMAYKTFPVKNESYQGTCFKDVEVKTGELECITTDLENGKRTVCKDLTEVIQTSYQCELTRDVNERARNFEARSCTKSACISKFGNSDCE